MTPLTAEERKRFADWLENEASTDESLVKQMETINVPEAVLKYRRMEIAAHQIVARKLRSITEEKL